jgi:hypothetical protein
VQNPAFPSGVQVRQAKIACRFLYPWLYVHSVPSSPPSMRSTSYIPLIAMSMSPSRFYNVAIIVQNNLTSKKHKPYDASDVRATPPVLSM